MPVTTHVTHGDPYEHVLADLRRRRDELDTAIRAVEAVRGPQSVATPQLVAPPPAVAPASAQMEGVYASVSIAEAAKMVLRANDGPMRTAEIVPMIQAGGVNLKSADPNNTTNSILSRRANSVGDIVRVGRSLWDLNERVGPVAQAAATLERLRQVIAPEEIEPPPE